MTDRRQANAYAATTPAQITTERRTAVGRSSLESFALSPAKSNAWYYGVGLFGFSFVVIAFMSVILSVVMDDKSMLWGVVFLPFGFLFIGYGIGGSSMLSDRLAQFAPSLNVETKTEPAPTDNYRATTVNTPRHSVKIPLVRNVKQIGAYSITSDTLLALSERIERGELRLTRDLDGDGRGFGSQHKSICREMEREGLAVQYLIGKTPAWDLTDKGVIWVLDDTPPY